MAAMSLSRSASVLFCVIVLAAHGCLARRPPRDNAIKPPKLSNRTVSAPVVAAPVANRSPKKLVAHGDVRMDPYFWLRDDDREDPEVIAYLEEENAYFATVLADTETLQEDLFTEMKSKIKQDDQSAPEREGKYFYYHRTFEGDEYKVRCRRKIPRGMGPPTELDVMDEGMAEEVVLNENKEANGHEYFDVKGFGVSPDHKLVKYSEDTVGDELYTLHVRNIATGKDMLKYPIEFASGDVAFANDGKTILYVTKNEEGWPDKAWLHKIGTDPKKDKLVHHEEDEAFYVDVGKTKDDKLLYILTQSFLSTEVRVIDAEDPYGEWEVLYEREYDVDYGFQHRNGHIYVNFRNAEKTNSELVVAPLSDPSKKTVLIPHKNDTEIEDFVLSENFVVVFQRENGLQTATAYKLPKDGSAPKSLGPGKELEFDEPAYEMTSGDQGDFGSDILRVDYTSLTTPKSVIDYNLVTGEHSYKRVAPVKGKFNRGYYKTDRIFATADDSTKIPITVAYRKDAVRLDGSDPLFMLVYGAYGVPEDPTFSSNRLSLLDRGFVYAIAHVRGGGELGRHWYEDGKFLKKKNTFTDTIACAEELIKRNYTSPPQMSMFGRSAGGMTAAAVVNMRPDLFKAVVLDVPFVDVLTSMLDESLPSTETEWDEWGDPNDKRFYHYIKSYSPVDNIKKKDYPHLLVTAGFQDPRVPYWEPAKFTAKLRRMKTDENMLVLKTDMGAGHFSGSGRFDELKDVAAIYAFVMKALGVADIL